MSVYGEEYRDRFSKTLETIQIHTLISFKYIQERIRNQESKKSQNELLDAFESLFGETISDDEKATEVEDVSLEEELLNEYNPEEGLSDDELNQKYSSYQIVCEELEGYEGIEPSEILKEMRFGGGFCIPLNKKGDFHQISSHIFMVDRHQDLVVIAHEMLHILETEIVFNEEEKTYDNPTGFSGKIEGVDTTLLSEHIHTLVLNNRIFPYMKEQGYDLFDNSDYSLFALPTNVEFFFAFERAILEARCGDINSLLNVVGRENFVRYAELQSQSNRRKPSKGESEEARRLLGAMKEYSREHLGERIGKATLKEQEMVTQKESVSQELHELIEDREQIKEEIDD